jgi:uncharacterized oligopeptide transporter (OPT) family protein
VLTALHPMAGAPDAVALPVWEHKVRFIGAGTIGIAAIWALVKLAAPVARGVRSAIAASGRRLAGVHTEQLRSEQDIPIGVVALASVACLVPLAALLAVFLSGGPLAGLMIPLVAGALQLVDATPWRQQVALVVGVIFGALVIPPILDLLNAAYGFNGAPAAHHPAGAQPLPAPQATLISALAQGVIQGKLDWGLLGVGVLVGSALIVLDEALGVAKKLRLPPLGVGIAIYLPASTTVPVILGAVCGWLHDRWAKRQRDPERGKRLGVLLASGLIVGESLFGVALAGIIVATSNANPLAGVGDSFSAVSNWIGGIAFIVVCAGLYRWIARHGAR